MKKSILLFALLTFSLFSCSNNDNDTTTSPTVDISKLAGTWLLDNAKLDGEKVSSSFKIELTSDNTTTFYYLFPGDTKPTTESGVYLTSNENLKISWYGSGTTSTYQILELTSTKLILKSIIPGEGTLLETYTK